MRALLLILCLMLPFSAQAGVLEDLESPVTTPAWIPALSGAGLTLALILLKNDIDRPLARSWEAHRPLGNWSKLGDYAGRNITNGLYFIGMGIAGISGDDDALHHAGVMFLATAYSVTASSILKVTVREKRPGASRNYESFPSGHSTSSFAFAAVVGAENGWKWGVPAYLLAAFTGISRINDNRHYLHDVTAGATIGLAYGLGVHYARLKDPKRAQVFFAPFWDPEGKGAQVTYLF